MKSKLLFFSLFIFIIVGCSSEKQEKNNTPSPATAQADPAKDLLDAVRANPNDHENNAKKLYEAAQLYVKNNKHQAALTCLNAAVRNHYSGTQTVQNGLMMADLYRDRYKKGDMAQVIYQALGQAFPNNEAITKAVEKNPISIATFSKFLDGMSSKLTNSETGKIESQIANDFVGATELHAMMAPKDSENPNYLHKAGEIARSMRAFPKAIDLYKWIYEKYPDSPKAAQALFMSAFTHDNELKQKDKAKNLYEEFLKKYPNDDFADDTQFLLKNLGKTNEEIIEGFGQQ